MSPIEYKWDLFGRSLARGPRPAASKHEYWRRIQVICNSLPKADIQNLFDSMPHRTTAHCSQWWLHQILILRTLFSFFCFENVVIFLYQYKSFAQ